MSPPPTEHDARRWSSPPIIGLTGSIGSGKSTVAAMLEGLGARVVDADRVGHEVYRPGTEGHREVVAAFGEDVVSDDGTIDRKRLGEKVFGDAAALARLNAIVHPRIGRTVAERIARFREDSETVPVVLEAALLVDSGWTSFVDEVWVITTPRDLALERTAAGRGVSREDLARRLDNQVPDRKRLEAADVVIRNEGSLDELQERVEELWQARFG